MTDKFHFHAENVYSPLAIAGAAAYAGILQADGAPEGVGTRRRRLRQAFCLHHGLVGNPQHARFRSGLNPETRSSIPSLGRRQGFWRRSGHALRGTILTRTDSGGETLSTWRIGSAYGAAYLSNQWYPDRLNTARLGFIQGSVTLGFDLVSNLATEFWPDLKSRVFHRN